MSHKLIDLQNRNEQDIIDDRLRRWSETLCNTKINNMRLSSNSQGQRVFAWSQKFWIY